MTYVPHSQAERQAMLAAIGVDRVEDLFADVPEALRFPEISLPEPLSEPEILRELQGMSESNADLDHYACFLGAGAYNHYVPSVVDHVLSRSEFYTAYTPYQPEVSQGTLQTIFEYQSMICALTGMDVANASHYDGATSMAEAVLMAVAVSRDKRRKVILSPTIHPEYRETVRTYTQGMGLTVVGDELSAWGQGIDFDPQALKALLDSDTACLIVQNPDFFGQMKSPAALQALADAVHAAGALFVISADPISLGLFTPPGDYGADIVIGEGQPLGNAISFGGPYLGYFACKDRFKHKMAGRLVGETVDTQGRRGFVLTLTAREQHIRREKATSNICSNQALCALAAGVYLATLGKRGLRTVAELCYHKAHYAASQIAALNGYQLVSKEPFFKEFVVRFPKPVAEVNRYLLDEWGIIGGYDLGQVYPHLAGHALLCVTEMNSRADIDDLVQALKEAAA
ncbi:MAG: aminomethyl-transferring glycine dehydrogenase subunit GcvPA [Anaerolineae bacterium]|jgi:glycine dehydrogenase subunit 1|nr:aminomethyl-transferring glycine dehydrogenase subunit GcvPA [Anaerolineae bacterium]MDH7474628.1 aminomethyl-transferring glycine dehydrogenase subunit GcvPA [Anaerolineae bacterium]